MQPREVDPSRVFCCARLHCTLPAVDCVARQVASDIHVTTDVERGVVSDFPTCVTGKCEQGTAIRRALEADGVRLRWRGAGPHGRLPRSRNDAVEQFEARCRLKRVGLLGEPPNVDEPPPEPECMAT